MNRRQNLKCAFALTIGFLMTLTATAQVEIPKSLVLDYEFSLASIPLGSVEKRLKFKNGNYIADSKIMPNSAAKLLFNGEVDEQSIFKIESDRIISLSFHAVRKKYKPYDRKAVFNHQKNTVEYNNGESEELRKNTYDLGSFPFAFMLEDLNSIENKVYQINTGHGYRAYVVLKPEQQQVSTPAGNFKTTKITLKRQDRENRFYYVWLADKTHYPVKIVRNKKGKESSLILKSVST